MPQIKTTQIEVETVVKTKEQRIVIELTKEEAQLLRAAVGRVANKVTGRNLTNLFYTLYRELPEGETYFRAEGSVSVVDA